MTINSMKILQSIIYLFVITQAVFAQNNNPHTIGDISANSLRNAGIANIDLRDKSVDGSFLLFDEWRPAVLLLNNNKKMSFDYFNFNLKTNQALVIIDKEEFALPFSNFQSFLIREPDIEAIDFINERPFLKLVTDEKELKLLELIQEGDWALYRHYHLDIKKANYNKALDQGNIQDKVVQKEVFYLKNKGKLLKLPSNRKKAIKRFSHLKKLSNYLQKNKINMKNEEELVELSNYLNTKK